MLALNIRSYLIEETLCMANSLLMSWFFSNISCRYSSLIFSFGCTRSFWRYNSFLFFWSSLTVFITSWMRLFESTSFNRMGGCTRRSTWKNRFPIVSSGINTLGCNLLWLSIFQHFLSHFIILLFLYGFPLLLMLLRICIRRTNFKVVWGRKSLHLLYW